MQQTLARLTHSGPSADRATRTPHPCRSLIASLRVGLRPDGIEVRGGGTCCTRHRRSDQFHDPSPPHHRSPETIGGDAGRRYPMNTRLGYTLSSEEHEPARLVELAVMAEERGFDFVSISDHFHPWITEQGHSPFVWSVLGAISAVTNEIEVGVGVTCPTIRIHPAILAQATATTANLLPDRFFWGVGSGEALNEQILGDGWPPADIRLDMLEEAVFLIRRMWEGESTTWRGEYYLVEDATVFDPPPGEVPIIVSAFGEKAAEVAARVGDGLWITGPGKESIDHYRNAGGEGPVYTQLHVCWAETEDEAEEIAHRVWPNTALPGSWHRISAHPSTSNRRSRWSRPKWSPRRSRAVRIPSGSSSPTGRPSTPASTTSTSTRSDPIRKASSTGGSPRSDPS